MKTHDLALTALLLLGACSPVQGEQDGAQKPAAPAPPAKVQASAQPGGFATVVLEPQAEERLGVRTVPAERRALPRARTLGAEATLPPGRSVIVSAPVAGTLRAVVPTLRAGEPVEAGATLFELLPLLSPERDVLTPAERMQSAKTLSDLELARVRARGDLEAARERVEAARIALERAQTLVESEAGSVRARDEARAELAQAGSAFAAAEASVAALEAVSLDAEAGEQAAIPLTAPLGGTLVALHVLSGQTVSAGSAVFDVAAFDPIWIRVPVYVGDLEQVELSGEALVGSLSGRTDAALRAARPVSAPPSANPLAASVDLWYELANGDGVLRPGQRLSATLPLQGEEQSLVVPWSAVLYDARGGSWVYEQTQAHTFVRRSVEVSRVHEGLAVLARGPGVGTAVVVAGAVELHGIEVGADK